MEQVSMGALGKLMRSAKSKKEISSYSVRRLDQFRDIHAKVFFYPYRNEEDDIYPFWKLMLVEEERKQEVYLGEYDTDAVYKILNEFMNQGKDESFLDKYQHRGGFTYPETKP